MGRPLEGHWSQGSTSFLFSQINDKFIFINRISASGMGVAAGLAFDEQHKIVDDYAAESERRLGPGPGAPSVYRFLVGSDPAAFAAAERVGTIDEPPSNHARIFAPVVDPTLRAGAETLLVAACARLGTKTASA